MKNTKILTKLLALVLVVLMVAISLTACGTANTNSGVSTPAQIVSITVKVIAADKTEKAFNIETDKKNLGDALFEEGLVTEAEHKSGFYTYIDGVRADYNKDGAWWCLTKGGNEVFTGFNDTKIADGDTFEITNTPA